MLLLRRDLRKIFLFRILIINHHYQTTITSYSNTEESVIEHFPFERARFIRRSLSTTSFRKNQNNNVLQHINKKQSWKAHVIVKGIKPLKHNIITFDINMTLKCGSFIFLVSEILIFLQNSSFHFGEGHFLSDYRK